MVLLPWTPPYDWAWMVGFLQARAVAGVERFHDGGYSRSFRVAGHGGLIHLAPDEEAQGLRVTLSPGLQPVAEICYARIGQLFDLACDPQQVARTLGDLAQARPGLRLPGALDAFEQAVRAVPVPFAADPSPQGALFYAASDGDHNVAAVFRWEADSALAVARRLDWLPLAQCVDPARCGRVWDGCPAFVSKALRFWLTLPDPASARPGSTAGLPHTGDGCDDDELLDPLHLSFARKMTL